MAAIRGVQTWCAVSTGSVAVRPMRAPLKQAHFSPEHTCETPAKHARPKSQHTYSCTPSQVATTLVQTSSLRKGDKRVPDLHVDLQTRFSGVDRFMSIKVKDL